jgi:hypothetical protein
MNEKDMTFGQRFGTLADDKEHPGSPTHPQGWIAVDFDGTLAEYHGWSETLGAPIMPMVERVKRWLAEGRDVRIFTARLHGEDYTIGPMDLSQPDSQAWKIRTWCLHHLGQILTITRVKDIHMIELWDDRAVQVEANTGKIIGMSQWGLA